MNAVPTKRSVKANGDLSLTLQAKQRITAAPAPIEVEKWADFFDAVRDARESLKCKVAWIGATSTRVTL